VVNLCIEFAEKEEAHGVPPPRASPPLLLRMVLNESFPRGFAFLGTLCSEGHENAYDCAFGKNRCVFFNEFLELKKNKKRVLHIEGTVQVSEWLNISDTAKKLY